MRRARTTAATLALIAAALTGAACDVLGLDGAGDAPPIDRETFVQTYVELHTAAAEADDAAAFDRAKAAILERRGIEESDLYGYIEAHGEDIEALAATWEEIDERLAARDTAEASAGEQPGDSGPAGAGRLLPDSPAIPR